MNRKAQHWMICSLSAVGLLSLARPSLSQHGPRPAPMFEAEAVIQPTGATKGLVLAGFPNQNGNLTAPDVIIDVRSGVVGLTPLQRAQIIVNRLKQAALADPLWFNTMSVGRMNDEWVIKVPAAPEGYILVCDKKAAGKIGLQPREFAEAVMSNIRRVAGLSKTHHKWLLKDLVMDNRADAYSNILLGDHYFQSGKAPYGAAISDYKIAFEQAPDSVEALTQLIAVYDKVGKKAKAAELRQKLSALQNAAEAREQADLACDAAVIARDEDKDNAEAIKQWNSAIAGYEKARDMAPTCLSFHLLVAHAYRELADTYAIAPPNESDSDRKKRKANQADAEAKMRETLIQCKNALYPHEWSNIAPLWGRQAIDIAVVTGTPQLATGSSGVTHEPMPASPAVSGTTGRAEPSLKFKAEAVAQANGEPQGLVLWGFPNEKGELQNPDVLFKALTGISGLTAAQRAQKIAERLTKTAAADPRWFDTLAVGQVNNEWVVKAPASPDGYLLTCDKKTAGKMGLQPREFAEAFIANTRRSMEVKKPRNRPAPVFEAEAVTQANGATKGLVLAHFPDENGDLKQPGVIIDVCSGPDGLTAVEYAQKIADLLNKMTAADPRWVENMSVGKVNGEWGIKVSAAPDGYILVGDKKLAARNGLQPREYAEAIMSNIRHAAGLSKPYHK